MVIFLALRIKLDGRRFSAVSYSPVTALMAERLTEASADTSFPGQPTMDEVDRTI